MAALTTPDKVSEEGWRHATRAFRHPMFRRFWTAALVSNAGSWLQNLAVPYVLFQLTHSALWVGLAAVAQFVPNVLCAPFGGALADRFERRRVLLVTQAGMTAGAIGLWLLWQLGYREPAAILALVAVAGAFQGLTLPGWQSFVNDLVPRADLTSAVALNSLQFNAARSVGPAVAGVLLATLGPGWAFLINAASYVAVIGALLVIRTGAAPAPGVRAPIVAGYVAAVRYLRRQPGIQAAILVSILVGILGNPVFSLTVVFASEVFKVGAVGLGLLNAALGVGAVLVAPMVAGGRRAGLARNVRWTFILYAAALAAFAATTHAVVAGLALVVVGGCFMAAISSANTAIQLIVADHMRGRVLALRITLYSTSLPLGTFVQSWLSDLVGVRQAMAGSAACMLAVGLVVAFWRGGAIARRLDDPHDESN
ncbi:MFS transporter [Nocardioides sp. Kera G14]|uniref:MFS transporter n=1 Tax=Nocardioides sp. Kera G14 TaxID=2884264 RepID=UPI001D12557E|nr:MFS transporter [Nocardioides sp. Kera G14]UDY24590.1 MFS transporter [Nocardioides sp. Kera G14]